MANEPTWSRALGNLSRTAKVKDGKWVPDPEKFNQKPNLEERLKAEDKKKKESEGALDMDVSHRKADAWAYGITPTPTPTRGR